MALRQRPRPARAAGCGLPLRFGEGMGRPGFTLSAATVWGSTGAGVRRPGARARGRRLRRLAQVAGGPVHRRSRRVLLDGRASSSPTRRGAAALAVEGEPPARGPPSPAWAARRRRRTRGTRWAPSHATPSGASSLALSAVTVHADARRRLRIVESMLRAAGLSAVVGPVVAVPACPGAPGRRRTRRPGRSRRRACQLVCGRRNGRRVRSDFARRGAGTSRGLRVPRGGRPPTWTQDHLDYHGDMQSYADAKAILFEAADRSHARRRGLTFVDDEAGGDARAAPADARLGVARAPKRGRGTSSSSAAF